MLGERFEYVPMTSKPTYHFAPIFLSLSDDVGEARRFTPTAFKSGNGRITQKLFFLVEENAGAWKKTMSLSPSPCILRSLLLTPFFFMLSLFACPLPCASAPPPPLPPTRRRCLVPSLVLPCHFCSVVFFSFMLIRALYQAPPAK